MNEQHVTPTGEISTELKMVLPESEFGRSLNFRSNSILIQHELGKSVEWNLVAVDPMDNGTIPLNVPSRPQSAELVE
jgi:hypothetical protein